MTNKSAPPGEIERTSNLAPDRAPAVESNNFDLLRFCFAAIVFFAHTHLLSHAQELQFLSRYLSREFAVQAFFVVSGFLIFMSYERSSSLVSYFEKRIRRIYPAYAAVVLVCAFGGAAVTTLPVDRYFGVDWLHYVGTNLIFASFLRPTLPGVFENNLLRKVNGALWTLKIEVAFYVCVPLIAWGARHMPRIVLLAVLYLASVAYYEGFLLLQRSTGREFFAVLARQFPGQLSYFVGGALLYYYFDALKRFRYAVFSFAVAAFTADLFLHLVGVRPLALAVIVVYLAYFAPHLGNFGRYGDFSYGLYVTHFPVVQLFVATGVFSTMLYLALGTVSVSVLALAVLFWYTIERPALRPSSHYVLVTG